jgi:hypothetical protein
MRKEEKMKNSRDRILWYGVLSLFIILTFTSYPAGTARAKDLPGWNSAASATFPYWSETLSMPAGDLKVIRLGEAFSNDGEVYPFEKMGSIYGITISGVLQTLARISYLRSLSIDR